ncbi:ICP22 family protein [Nocardiopsis coralli]|uniref:hypothetical protein n=1 Tax=Nocardiopsis coralli TaxID=2772213 RepID=UPI002E2C46E3|nr:hypothetical protein [Nocardiopsis coralli]
MAGSALAATVVVVVPAVLYPLVGVWTLLWLVLVAAVAGFLALGGPGSLGGPGTAGRDGHQDGAAQADGPRAHPGAAHNGSAPAYADGPAHGTRVGEIALATAVPDYDLQLSAVVHWRWSGHVDLTVRNPVAPAVRDVVCRAATKVARTRPRDHARTECDLAAHLAVEHAVTGTGIVVWAEHVRLHLPEEDAERLARLSDLRKDLGLRAALQETERAHGNAYGRAHASGPARAHGGAVPEPTSGYGFGPTDGRFEGGARPDAGVHPDERARPWESHPDDDHPVRFGPTPGERGPASRPEPGPVPPPAGGAAFGDRTRGAAAPRDAGPGAAARRGTRAGESARGRRPWGGSWSRFGASPASEPEAPEDGFDPFEDAAPNASEGRERPEGPGLPAPPASPGRRPPYGSHPEPHPEGPYAHGSHVHGPGAPRPGAHGDDGGEEHDYVYLDPVHGMPEEPVFTGPDPASSPWHDPDGAEQGLGPELDPDPGLLPGHDVDEYGYESYWWPAESIPDSAEEDVQVAILRGMIDAVPDRHARAEFAEQQLSALEKAGYGEVARRVREGF